MMLMIDKSHTKIIHLEKYSFADCSARKRCRKLVLLDKAELISKTSNSFCYRVPSDFIIYPKR